MLSEQIENALDFFEKDVNRQAFEIRSYLPDIKQHESDKAELQKALIEYIDDSCDLPANSCKDISSCIQCRKKRYIQLLEKQMGKSWAEIKEGKI